MRVLFLAAWYPTRNDAMSGLFVRKHAEAVARLNNVSVLYMCADDAAGGYDIVDSVTNGVREVYVYYPAVRSKYGIVRKAIRYIRAFKKGYDYLAKEWGRPDVCQVNVLTRAGVLAWWLKMRHKIPYVVVEHWSRYLPEDFHYTGVLRRLVTRHVVRNASCVLAVSQELKDAMQSLHLVNRKFKLVDNVVDDLFFADYDYKPERESKIRALHVSCIDNASKNITGILDAVALLSARRADFELHIVGDGPDIEMVVSRAKALGLYNTFVFFEGEKSPRGVCEAMREADFFVLFSHFETASVVICEALATGLPIVSSGVCQIPRMVRADVDVLVPPADSEALAEGMSAMMDKCRSLERASLRHAGLRYSYANVGRYLTDVYTDALTEHLQS